MKDPRGKAEIVCAGPDWKLAVANMTLNPKPPKPE